MDYVIELTEEQRQLLLGLIRAEQQTAIDPNYIQELEEVEELFD